MDEKRERNGVGYGGEQGKGKKRSEVGRWTREGMEREWVGKLTRKKNWPSAGKLMGREATGREEVRRK